MVVTWEENGLYREGTQLWVYFQINQMYCEVGLEIKKRNKEDSEIFEQIFSTTGHFSFNHSLVLL
jgi:hypothetical protein